MICRCSNINTTNSDRYIGRGITVCKEWKDNFLSFETWALDNGYKKSLTIDRIDNDGNYEPDNCRWVDMRVQNNNKGLMSTNKSGLIGVFKDGNYWRTNVSVNKKIVFSKRYKDKNEANRGRNKFILDNNLPNALNKEKDEITI